MIGPNKKLVHAEIAMKFLRILLPEFQDPDVCCGRFTTSEIDRDE